MTSAAQPIKIVSVEHCESDPSDTYSVRNKISVFMVTPIYAGRTGLTFQFVLIET